MSPEEKRRAWKALCGLAVELCGGQEQFKREANILKSLARKYGPQEVERMIRGAKMLGWHSLVSLGSAEGLGRRLAIQAFWQDQKRAPLPEALKDIFRRLGSA